MNGLEVMEKINDLKEKLESLATHYAAVFNEDALSKMTEITKEIVELKEKLSKVNV